jgi:transposase
MEKHKIELIDKRLNVKAEPDPEVGERKPRRKYTAQYKLEILARADRCTQPGQIGALLREEGLYSSNLTSWRRQRDNGVLNALSPHKRGRKNIERNPLSKQVASLQRENERLKKKLRQAETIIEFQKKISEILGIPQDHGLEIEE